MTSKLHIADDLSLSADAVTQTFAILAKRGAGKTYTAAVMAEEMLKAGQSVVALDPTGAWYGLRSEFPVVILGGEHADVPLEESAGETIAKAIVDNRFSAVLDLSLFRKGQMIRFMVTFAETLYRLNREPLHLFVDEADAVAPQGRTYGGEENRMLGAMEDIVRRGRKRGIGCTLITQRPAVLNKNVLTQCEVLVAMRLVHPKDIDAVREWVNVHADPKQAQAMEDSLPSLPIGDAWFWSPGWGDIFKRVHVRKRETFDSSATPKPGEAVRKPKHLTPIDVANLGEQIKATVEKAKADDPRELRKRIADLERQLKGRPAETKTVEVEKVVKVPVLQNGQLDKAHRLAERLEKAGKFLVDESSLLRQLVAPAFAKPAPPPPRPMPKPSPPRPMPRPSPPRPVPVATESANGQLPTGEQKILIAAAQYDDGVERDQLSVLTGYKRSSRDAYVSRLQAKGYVEVQGGRIVATQAGIDALGSDFNPLPSGQELRDYWMARLPDGERKILQVLVDEHPNTVPRDALDEPTGYRRSSRDAYLSRLKARRLVVFAGRGEVRASDELF